MISEMRMLTLGVKDIDRATRFYADVFAYEVKGEAVYDAQDVVLAKAWQMPQGLEGTLRVLGPVGAESALIRLMSFNTSGEAIWGEYENFQDLGPFAMNIRVADIEIAAKRLIEAGATVRSKPTLWTLSEGVGAYEGQWIEPDGTLLDVFQMVGDGVTDEIGDLNGFASALQTIAIHNRDGNTAKRFYEALGFEPLYDRVFEDLEWLLHLPKGTNLRNINMRKPDLSLIGRVELAEYIGCQGKETRDKAKPPNTGVLSLSLEVDDLAQATDIIIQAGGEMIDGPASLSHAPFGAMSLSTFFGPDGEVIEFFQRHA